MYIDVNVLIFVAHITPVQTLLWTHI